MNELKRLASAVILQVYDDLTLKDRKFKDRVKQNNAYRDYWDAVNYLKRPSEDLEFWAGILEIPVERIIQKGR